MDSLRGLLSSLLLAVAFFVGNIECHPTSREKRSLLAHEAMETCKKMTQGDCVDKLAVIDSLEMEIEKLRDQVNRLKNLSVETGTEIVGNFFTLWLPDLQC